VEESDGEERLKTVANVLFPAIFPGGFYIFSNLLNVMSNMRIKKEADFKKSQPLKKNNNAALLLYK
jgi:hypothetical protein